MMLVRAGFLVLAAVLAMLRVPLLALWVVLCLVGAVVLPWLAVIWANNRRPRPEYRLGNRFRPRPAAVPPAQPRWAPPLADGDDSAIGASGPRRRPVTGFALVAP